MLSLIRKRDKLRTQEGHWDCLWREAKETGNQARDSFWDVYTESLFSSGPDFAGELRGCVTSDKLKTLSTVPERRNANAFANKKKGQTSGTKEGPWDCLWREAKETGVIRRGILGDVYTESLSRLALIFAGELRGCVTSDKLKTLSTGELLFWI
ncbi:hypothetical protein CEXT_679411 [Caerostris extrusa]|uniref:Uncharacterized protein n=1 Tax=Caerostris extrusa TaxID=172846 RepID=A0AAV4SP98_CAEEX|nr:hypothetical protein CEXT_679411 [Caerostris extrusa]